jgi:magnesium-transporting ATPase (P-type)
VNFNDRETVKSEITGR